MKHTTAATLDRSAGHEYWGNEQGSRTPEPALKRLPPRLDYSSAYQTFLTLVTLDHLDDRIQADCSIASELELGVNAALEAAYLRHVAEAHLFLHRVLYRINRLKLFWYDDLESYENERSSYLRTVRDRIEHAWEQWESSLGEAQLLRGVEVSPALRQRATDDVDPPLSPTGRYFTQQAAEGAYRKLLQIASLDALVEASQLSRTLGGVANEVQAMLTRLLLEEYGCGRLARKYSSYFIAMLNELKMDATPEAYFEAVPWEVLAVINHSFLLERKRYFLRYVGGLLYTEISVPSAFRSYRACAERLGLREEAMAYWDLHIKEDVRHGRWMLDDVALPLAQRYPSHAWELVLGYDQQRRFSSRAAAAILAAACEADGFDSSSCRDRTAALA